MNCSRLPFALAALSLSLPTVARADERVPATTTKDGYGYHFDDDPMSGGSLKDAAPRPRGSASWRTPAGPF